MSTTLYPSSRYITDLYNTLSQQNYTSFYGSSISGKMFNSSVIKTLAESELGKWKNITEKNSSALPYLEEYSKAVGKGSSRAIEYANDITPWSAAFISWFVTQYDTQFKVSEAHSSYTRKNNGITYTAYPLNEDLYNNGLRIFAQPGDILIRGRWGGKTSHNSSHGDVVWKIEGGKAYVIGGNTSSSTQRANTVGSKASYDISNDGTYNVPRYKNTRGERILKGVTRPDFEYRYVIVLKKNL